MTDLTDHDRAAHCPHMTGEVCTICQRLHELEAGLDSVWDELKCNLHRMTREQLITKLRFITVMMPRPTTPRPDHDTL